MKGRIFLLLAGLMLLVNACTSPAQTPVAPTPARTSGSSSAIKLPEREMKSETSLEETLSKRRSVREYTGRPLTLREVSQLLWAAQGVTTDWGGRTVPSAGGLYPLEVYLVAGDVEGITAGVYKYNAQTRELIKLSDRDPRKELADAALEQSPVKDGAAAIVLTAVYERTTVKYGDRGIRYVHMEAGHAAQNVYLQATSLGLGTVTIGAFNDDRIKAILSLPEGETPLYIMPVGKK